MEDTIRDFGIKIGSNLPFAFGAGIVILACAGWVLKKAYDDKQSLVMALAAGAILGVLVAMPGAYANARGTCIDLGERNSSEFYAAKCSNMVVCTSDLTGNRRCS